MLESIVAYFSKPEMGIMGILVILLLLICGAMIKRLDKKDEDIKSLNAALVAIQENRVKEYATVIENDTKTKADLISSVSAVQKGVDGIVRVLELKKNL